MTSPLSRITEQEVRVLMQADDEERRSFGCLRCDRGMLPLAALDVDARIVGTFAHTTVSQTFVNSSGVPVEATYIFPLPDRAAVTRFTMEVAGRRVEGDLQERGQAHQTYDRAIREGKRASIAEEERPGTFTLRVGNLMAGEAATITLELTGPLSIADGEVTYRFPLVVAPRYMPGSGLVGDQVGDGVARDTDAVPDASRISPPVRLGQYPNPVRLGIAVTLDGAGLPLSQVRSALHTAWANESEGLLRVQVSEGERLDRDFILRFRLGDGAMRTSARATKGLAEDAFLLTVLPAISATQKRPRDVVFVVDRSGSMGGWKMVAARRSVARMVDSLRAADRFSVLAFDDRVEVCPELGGRLVHATDRNRFRAVEWLATVTERGGTEMALPLSTAAELLAGGDLERDRVLVFVTDGQVGNEAQVLKALGSRLRGSRVFALGIDQAVNAGFMNRLAALGGQGEAELVEHEDRVDDVLVRCHRRIDTPLLRDLQVQVEDGDLVSGSLAPGRLPDVFDGVPAVIVGKLRRRGNVKPTIVVTGTDAAGGRFSSRVPVETSGNKALVPAWGRLHLRDLEDAFDGGKGDRATLTRQIVQVSLETKVLCRFTAFVAVDHEVVNRGGRVQQVVHSVESPAGWGRGGGDSLHRGAARSPAPMAAPARAPATDSFEDDDRNGDLGDFGDGVDDDRGADDDFDEVTGGGSFGYAPAPAAAPAPAPATRSAAVRPAPMRAGMGGPPAPAAAAPPKASRSTTTADLSAFIDRLRDVIAMLKTLGASGIDDVIESLRLMVEEAAHSGVGPAARKPLVDAIASLERRAIDEAITTLQAAVDALPGARRGGSFWG